MERVLGLFDRAFVINREQDIERMKLTKRRLDAVGIAFERFPARSFTEPGNYRWAGMRGIYASHLAIVQTAKSQNLSNVLIMEDDVIFRPRFRELWSEIVSKLDSLTYDIFFGYNWWNTQGNPKSLNILRIQTTLCTHFWVIHSRFYDAFIEIALANEAAKAPACIDGIFTAENSLLYAPTYNLVGQDEGISLVAEGMPKKIRWHADKHKHMWLLMK